MSQIFKRSTLLALSFAITASLFSGCGQGKVSNNATKTPQVSDESEKKPVLKVLLRYSKDDLNTYPVSAALEQKTGYKVEYEMLPQDKPYDKLNLLIAGGEPYDVVTIGNNKDIYSDYARRNALNDLSPLIDKYGANIKTAVSQKSFDSIKVDGKVYGIPTAQVPTAGESIMVRQDWLDKLNMKAPTTVDEFTAMLKAFKEKDPGGNADKNIPLTMHGDAPLVPNLAGAFGMESGWTDVNGKLTPNPLNPEFKEYLTYMSDLYKQGFIDKEFATNKIATAKEKFASGRAGAIPLGYADVPDVVNSLIKNKPEAKTTYIPTLKGKDGKSGLNAGGGLDRLSFIPKSSKNPEHAMKWMNAKLDKDTFKVMTIGEEGVHYTVKDGNYLPILPKFLDERNNASMYLTGIDEKNYPTYWQARVRKDPKLFEAWEFMNIKQPAETRKLDIMQTAPYLAEYTKNAAQLSTLQKDYMVKVLVGAEPLTGLDGFVKKWKEAGGEASYNEVNSWYGTTKK